MNEKAAVIGAGIRDLAAAIRLALKGYDTHIFEKNGETGGLTGTGLPEAPFIRAEAFPSALSRQRLHVT